MGHFGLTCQTALSTTIISTPNEWISHERMGFRINAKVCWSCPGSMWWLKTFIRRLCWFFLSFFTFVCKYGSPLHYCYHINLLFCIIFLYERHVKVKLKWFMCWTLRNSTSHVDLLWDVVPCPAQRTLIYQRLSQRFEPGFPVWHTVWSVRSTKIGFRTGFWNWYSTNLIEDLD